MHLVHVVGPHTYPRMAILAVDLTGHLKLVSPGETFSTTGWLHILVGPGLWSDALGQSRVSHKPFVSVLFRRWRVWHLHGTQVYRWWCRQLVHSGAYRFHHAFLRTALGGISWPGLTGGQPLSLLLMTGPWAVCGISRELGRPANSVRMQQVTMSGSPEQSCACCSGWFRIPVSGIMCCRGSGTAVL